jgi:hypothetical protein
MTSTTLTRDRNYYRMCDDSDLIRAARDSGDELTLVMAERLAEVADLEHECGMLHYDLETERVYADNVRRELEEAEEEIERLHALVNAQ